MANESKANTELDELAFEIYSKRVASNTGARGGRQEAIDSYRKAEEFLAVRNGVRAGDVKPKEADGPQLCNCWAPKLRRTHPHNLVSQQVGDLQKVSRIKAWLDRNPTPENEPSELVTRINSEFPDLSWDLSAVNVARAIFGAYVKA